MRNFAKKCAKAPIKLYCAVVSPLLGPNCRFEPTCSAYTLMAIEKHGALRGLFLGVKRICKCQPYSKCEHNDPVPSKFNW